MNLVSRYGNITSDEIEKAFKRADIGLPTLLGIFNHDFRDMGWEIEYFWDLLLPIVAKYPEVQFKYERAKDAFNAVLGNEPEPFELDVNLEGNELSVKTVKGKVFGPATISCC